MPPTHRPTDFADALGLHLPRLRPPIVVVRLSSRAGVGRRRTHQPGQRCALVPAPSPAGPPRPLGHPLRRRRHPRIPATHLDRPEPHTTEKHHAPQPLPPTHLSRGKAETGGSPRPRRRLGRIHTETGSGIGNRDRRRTGSAGALGVGAGPPLWVPSGFGGGASGSPRRPGWPFRRGRLLRVRGPRFRLRCRLLCGRTRRLPWVFQDVDGVDHDRDVGDVRVGHGPRDREVPRVVGVCFGADPVDLLVVAVHQGDRVRVRSKVTARSASSRMWRRRWRRCQRRWRAAICSR